METEIISINEVKESISLLENNINDHRGQQKKPHILKELNEMKNFIKTGKHKNAFILEETPPEIILEIEKKIEELITILNNMN